ncbi:MAG: alpha-amylase family glycosyl hydrolase [Planctomycetia bacterium]|nr:alpha-amylase family glycosyl hydrolase [Planctomycetia bacterium]
MNLFAPCRLYGTPEDFRAFVNHAHELGIGLILDVVYNHFGPVGNYLAQYSDHYFTDRHVTEWGAAINFDDADSAIVRDYFLTNVRYWIEEFHLDGYRFDATQAIADCSPRHILAEMSEVARAAAKGRRIHLSVENQPQDVINLRATKSGGFGMDAIWNDDFHHSARVCATGRNEGYYRDFAGHAQELVTAARHGFLYQGQARVNGQERGSGTRGFDAWSFVSFLQNHDQVANSAYGLRLHQLASPARFRALTALWLFMPQTPMFLQGQEFCASSPFLYYADLAEELGRIVWEGRKSFLSQFPSLATLDMQATLPDPCARRTFEQCKLDLSERQSHAHEYRLHVDLLQLRKSDPVLQRQDATMLDGVAFSTDALALRYFTDEGYDRLILTNFGRDLSVTPPSQPLLAAPAKRHWELIWSSEHPKYGGQGTSPWKTDAGWCLAADTTLLFAAAD